MVASRQTARTVTQFIASAPNMQMRRILNIPGSRRLAIREEFF